MATTSISVPDIYDYRVKLITIGDSGTGKTQYSTASIADDPHQFNIVSTIGVEFFSRIIDLDQHKLQIFIWDTAGQERFQAITRAYYKGVAGVLVFFDLTKRVSFQNVKYWVNEVRSHGREDLNMILIGTFHDQPQYREVPYQEALEYARKEGMEYEEISAKVPTLSPVKTLVRQIMKRLEKKEILPIREFGIETGSEEGSRFPTSMSGRCCTIS